MEEQQDGTKQLQNPPPPDLGRKRKYIRKLLEAFEPHQEAMFADLDRQIEESNPDRIWLRELKYEGSLSLWHVMKCGRWHQLFMHRESIRVGTA